MVSRCAAHGGSRRASATSPAAASPTSSSKTRDLDLAVFRRVGPDEPSLLHPGEKLRYEDGETIKTHGVYTEGGGDGRGRTKINVVDWDGDGVLDLLLGVGPQHGSPYRRQLRPLTPRTSAPTRAPCSGGPKSSCGTTKASRWSSVRHGVHPAPVDWDGDGKYELVAGADQGRVWYWKPEHFGASATGDPTAPRRPQGEAGLGRDD